MNRYLYVLSITLCTVIYSCKNKTINSREQKYLLQGEWVLTQSFESPEILLINNETYRPEVFPMYNYLIFDTATNTIKTHAVGEFGVGKGVSQSLNLADIKWEIKNNQLHLKGNYRDYRGVHSMDNLYNINKRKDTLLLLQKKV